MALPDLEAAVAFTSDPGAAVPVWTVLPSDIVKEFSSKRGRADEKSETETGVMTWLMRNQDRRLDPEFAGILVNLVPNPSPQLAVTGFLNNANSTVSREAGQGIDGDYGFKAVAAAAAAMSVEWRGRGAGDRIEVTPGVSYAFSLYARALAAYGENARLRIHWHNSAGAILSSSNSAYISVPTAYGVRHEVVAVAPALAVSVRITWDTETAAAAGDVYYFDHVQFEAGTSVSAYVDGAMSNARWAGTAYASESYRGGPYYPNLNPVKQARLRATIFAVTYDILTGDVEDWPQLWEGRENNVAIDILDAFDALDDVDISIDRGIELTGARINAILDAVGWPAGMRSIDTGQSLIAALTDLTNGEYRNALSMLKETKDTEYGNIFINGQGWFVFHDRHRRLKSPHTTSQVTLANVPAGGELPFSKAHPKRAKKDIVNIAQITSGGVTYVAEDATSQARYRKRSYSKTVLLTNTNDPPQMAAYIVSQYKDPTTSWDYVVLEPQLDDALWAHALGREIGDRVTIKATPPGGGAAYNIQGIIEKVEHKYTVGRWTTTWRLGRADISNYWILGTSVLGTGTRLAY